MLKFIQQDIINVLLSNRGNKIGEFQQIHIRMVRITYPRFKYVNNL